MHVEDRHLYTLIAGRDATGKSTLLQNIESHYGDLAVEVTGTEAIRAFKRASQDKLVDLQFINDREELFLDLTLSNRCDRSERSYATTSDPLVTLLSHAVMRSMVSSQHPFRVSECLEKWGDFLTLQHMPRPDIIALLYVDGMIADARIRERQTAGDVTEKFWGFNAPSFLSRYQQAWHETVDGMCDQNITQIVKIDTGAFDERDTLRLYSQTRAVCLGELGALALADNTPV